MKDYVFSLSLISLLNGNSEDFFFINVLGSEGKLSMPDQRISVLQAIGNVSKNAVSGANTLQNLSTNVAEKFITLLQAEGSYC